MTKKKRYRKIDAKRPLVFTITPEDVESAVCGDPENCVIARACTHCLGDLFESIQVGASITKVVRSDGMKVRYKTPAFLRRALIVFDTTGVWDLPPGEYRLAPPKPSSSVEANAKRNRLHTIKKKKPGCKKKRKAYLPSRRVARVDSLMPE